MCEEYNGWPNKHTWAVALMIDNDQGLYEMSREIVAQSYEYNFHRDEALRDWYLDYVVEYDTLTLVQQQHIGDAIAYVEWREIVDNIMEELAECE